MTDTELELPQGWKWCKFQDVTDVVRGGSPRPKGDPRYFGGTIPWIMIRDISKEKGKFLTKTKDTVTEEGAKKSRLLKKGSLILSNSGTVCVPKILKVDGCIHDGFLTFPDIPKNMNMDYAYYWFEKIRTKIRQENQQGITQVNLNIQIVKIIDVPLPPLNEQKRIVSKIEELFSRIDSTKQSLEHTKLQLEQYKKSLLTSAFEGKLTDTKQYDDQLEIPKLLQLIESERNDIFLKTILKNNLSGDRFKQISPREYNPENMPISTKKWHIVSLETVCSFVQGGMTPLRTETSNFSETGFPLIKVENVLKNGIVFLKNDQLRITPKPHNKMWRSKVFPDDLLINIVGPPLGKIGLVPKKFPESNINQAIVLMRTVPSYLNKFLLFCLQSPKYYDYQLKLSSGVRQENIRKSSIGTIPIPLPSLKEQKEIVSQIEQGFSLIENTSQIVESTLQNLQTMKMSILKQAFEGKLVPQDPNDEPASVLLEKIKVEKS